MSAASESRPGAGAGAPRVLIVETGSANLASVEAALRRRGVDAARCTDPAQVVEAAGVVLPGVGAFRPARRRLAESGLDEALRTRVLAGRPLLAICLGLQLLCEGSEEAPGEAGLGLVPGVVRRLSAGARSPHMGWNQVEVDTPGRALCSGSAYFANGYALGTAPPADSVGWTCDGERFVSAVERGGLLACQFHPELSGAYGAGLLASWLDALPTEELTRC